MSHTLESRKEGDSEKSRYRSTLNLPQTGFPMKANLLQNEPASLKRWDKIGVYARLREMRASARKFVFHDGPPYANGSIHLGHLTNKVLKDMVVRARTMAGLDVPYVPGWDCHGLPIEHKVMTDLVESGKADKLSTLEDGQRRIAVRRECAKHAEKYVKLQSGQFQRLMTLADYEHPYLTMTPAYEAAVLEVLLALHEQGLVYRALKPVHWSVANETALADAELEYYDREDVSIYVDFEAEDMDAVYDAFGLPRDEEVEFLDGEDEGSDEAAARPAWTPDEGVVEESAARPTQRPCFMIWTTTPWTLPANLAIAVNPALEYALVRVDGNVTVMAAAAVERVVNLAKAQDVQVLAKTTGDRLVGLRYRHPFVEGMPEFDEVSRALGHIDLGKVYTLMAADYVTLEDGTGLVHTAPGHGVEDYQTGQREGLPVYCPVLGNGKYDQSVPEWLRGVDVWTANQKVLEHLRASGHLFHDHRFMHSYPHDWRSKTPTIFRCTEQWFVGVDRPTRRDARTLRELAQNVTAAGRDGSVNFVPEWGRNRMRGMLESRPDWCISRQRSWGLPIPAFVTPDGHTLMTAAMLKTVIAVVRAKGSDAWFQMTPIDLLAGYDPAGDEELVALLAGEQRDEGLSLARQARNGVEGQEDDLSHAREAPKGATKEWVASLRKGGDILDVWFESGSSWHAVMRQREIGFPVDLYLEGSDQHRGWFQLSLLPSLGMTGSPAFRTVLTHGFVVDKDGKKLSKSKGDTVEGLLNDYGVDVLRWWVSSVSYENDLKVDREFFDAAGESYRKVRNTLRFMLSNLSDYAPGAQLDVPARSLDGWALAKLDELSREVRRGFDSYDFRAAHSAIYDFCNDTLSAVYLAAVKDRLYCDRKDSPRRRQTQGVLWRITETLCTLLAPVLPHTADEAYRALWKAAADDVSRCVHLMLFASEAGAGLDPCWREAMEAREVGLLALERARSQGGVENPLDAGVTLPDPTGLLAQIDLVDLADLLGVSRVELDPAAKEASVRDLRDQPRCERSWKRDGTVRLRADGGMLSDRDAEAVGTA